ncbi:adenylyltransferase/cytidyltransferase family protein [Sphingomonas sp. DT-204]|uniref:adenylyltransferase/cytidyltransferase family protein n=1 Tax=Sphingomonas sp. DT-204 TaxID=3396166 RepID=UPI003F1D2777
MELSTQAIAALPRPLVFTNGVFDVLHRGHVTYLAAARSLGAGLFVAVNSDASVRMLGKGPDRPINRAEDRAIVLAALESVTAVSVFEERAPLRILAQVRPDIYVKGGDYTLDQLPEAELMREWGGRTVIMPFVDGFSTTELLRRVRSI